MSRATEKTFSFGAPSKGWPSFAKTDDNPKRETVYVAGPMRGYLGCNFGTFDLVAQELRLQGLSPISPADHDRELGHEPPPAGTICDDAYVATLPFTMREVAEWDLARIMDADRIVMLPGWEKSKGATAEHAVAVWVGKKIGFAEISQPRCVTGTRKVTIRWEK